MCVCKPTSCKGMGKRERECVCIERDCVCVCECVSVCVVCVRECSYCRDLQLNRQATSKPLCNTNQALNQPLKDSKPCAA